MENPSLINIDTTVFQGIGYIEEVLMVSTLTLCPIKSNHSQAHWRMECHLSIILRAVATRWPGGHHEARDMFWGPRSAQLATWVGLPNVW